MTTTLATAFFLFGILALWIGGEGIVRSVMSYARVFKIGAFVLSLTLLAAATSAPELFFNVFAAIQGRGDIGIGNILGSNVTNFALIFAIATLFIPLKKRDEEAVWAYPALFGISLFFFLLGLDGVINRFEGVMLIVLFFVWMFLAVKGEHKKRLLERIGDALPEHRNASQIALTTTLFVASIALLAGGAELLVRSIEHFSLAWDFSPFLLAALLVALGTSLPELATVLVAVFKKRDDIRSGTIFGSNIFNLTLIIGVTALIHPIEFSQTNFLFLALLVIVTTMLAAPIIFNFRFQSRLWSVLLLASYAFFLIYITTQLIA